MRKMFKRLFYCNEWAVGVRKIDPNTEFPINNTLASYHVFKGKGNAWYADPLLFEYDNKTYCFMEIMNIMRGIGSIGVAEIRDGRFLKITEIIKEPFHMSFPNVFEFNGSIYMIPETSEKREIRLYKSVSFPYQWEFDRVLVDGVDAVDSTIRIENGMLYIFTYLDGEGKSRVYQYDFTKNDFGKEIMDVNIPHIRPAGRLIQYQDQSICPLQDCTGSYGKRIFLYKESGSIGNGDYTSYPAGIIEPKNIIPVGTTEAQCVHTISRTQQYECVDFTVWRPHFFALLYKIKHKIKNKG